MLKYKGYFLYLGLHIHTSYTLLPLSAERKLFVNCYDLCRKSLLILSVAIGKKQPTLKRVFACCIIYCVYSRL